MKKFYFLIFFLYSAVKIYGQSAVLPYTQDFSSGNDFSLVNGTQTNKWEYGSATGNSGNAIYISNDLGVSNTYSNNSTSTVHAYREIDIPVGTTYVNFSFDWRAYGNDPVQDYFRVWLVPATFTPTAGSIITASGGRIQVGANFEGQNTWQTYTNPILNLGSFAGNKMRLVFQWRNNGVNGANPPAAIDNISLSIPSCVPPSMLTTSGQTPDGITLEWTPPSSSPASGYEYYYSLTNTAPATTFTGTPAAGNSMPLSGLTDGATYYWWVRTTCSPSGKSEWVAGPPFTLGLIGTGTSNTSSLPAYSCSGYNYSQQIYTAAEIQPALGNNYLIKKIKFYVNTTAAAQANYNQWVVYMGNVSQGNFATTSSWVPASSLAEVYSGTLPAMSAGTWVEIPLSTPYTWDGVSNIVIAVDENSPNSSCTAQWGSYSAGTNRGINYYNTNNNPDPANPPTATARYSTIPRLILEGEELQPCTTLPPDNISVIANTAFTATVTWVPTIGGSYKIRYKKTTNPLWIEPPGTVISPMNSAVISSLEELTQYEVQVSTICGGVQGAWSVPLSFTTPAISYCNMTGTGTNDHISNVTVTSANPGVLPFSNTSVQTNYISYPTPVITLDMGSVGNKISVSKGWNTTSYNDGVAAWIDFNRNGDFEASEKILDTPADLASPVTSTFDVPATTYSGPKTITMRVVLKRNNSPVMCEGSVLNGEVEDYQVVLRPCVTTIPAAPSVSGITHIAANINWSLTPDLTYLVRYKIQGVSGPWTEIYASSALGNIPLTISGLDPATAYEVQVAAVCGSSSGIFSPVSVFTTRCDPTPPTVTISNITPNSAFVTWAPLAVSSSYIMRYRVVGTTTWTDVNLPNPPANTYSITGLSPYTTYEVQIANQCIGETTPNTYSNPQVFTTERICELPPPGLTISSLTTTSGVVTWDPFSGATYILRYRKVGIPSWTTISLTTNTYTLTGLSELTGYEMQVVNVCNGIVGTYTQLYFFTTPTIVYCDMYSASTVGGHISKVSVKPNGKPVMENTSSASSYTDYTDYTVMPDKVIELIQGTANNELIIEKTLSGNTNAGVAAWIDFNRNGYFDINERILVSSPNNSTMIQGIFSVPADAFVSLTDYKYVVMRIAMQKDGIPVNCTDFTDGEVEDYTVRISKPVILNPLDQTQVIIYPNPVKSVLYVKNISTKAQYKIYNSTGQMVSNGIILKNNINVSSLINGVYIIDIEDNGIFIQKKFIKE